MPTGVPNDPITMLRRARLRARREELRIVARLATRLDRELRPLGLRMDVVPLNGAARHPPATKDQGGRPAEHRTRRVRGKGLKRKG